MTDCLLCSAPLDAAPLVGTMSRGGKPSRRLTCSRCGLVQVHPAPTPESLTAYYQGDYHKDHQPTGLVFWSDDGAERFVPPGTAEHDEATAYMHEARARAVVRDLGLKPGDRVLEIGCAEGRTLAALAALGMKTYGLEPDAAKAATAAEGPHEGVWCLTIEDAHEADGFIGGVDAVIAFHVLEHFNDPLAALGHIRQLLRPGGQAWFEVPNLSGPALPLTEHWMWVHLFDFSRHTIKALLHRAGFDEIKTSECGNLPSKPIGILRACGVNGASPPREYEDHNGPTGADVQRFLQALEDGQQARLEAPTAPLATLRAFMTHAIADLGPDAEDRLRADCAIWAAAEKRKIDAWGEIETLLQGLHDGLLSEAELRLETHHPDDYVHGFTYGEAHGLWRARAVLGHVAAAMRMKRLTDGG